MSNIRTTLVGACAVALCGLQSPQAFAEEPKPPKTVEAGTYLADVSALFKKQWPTNRAVNIVCHGHSVPAKEKQIKVLLLTPTAALSADLDNAGDPLNQQAAMIKALAKEQEVGLVDSLAEFQSYVKNGGKLADLMCHENHPNRKGHELVAKKLLEWFPE